MVVEARLLLGPVAVSEDHEVQSLLVRTGPVERGRVRHGGCHESQEHEHAWRVAHHALTPCKREAAPATRASREARDRRASFVPGGRSAAVARRRRRQRQRIVSLDRLDAGPEHAVRGRAWLSPALLEGRPPPAWSKLPTVWDSPDPQGDFRDAQARLFVADAHGRLAADPTLARASGGRMRFFAAGRYVLSGSSDLGTFRVEVELPAPGGVDVDLSQP